MTTPSMAGKRTRRSSVSSPHALPVDEASPTASAAVAAVPIDLDEPQPQSQPHSISVSPSASAEPESVAAAEDAAKRFCRRAWDVRDSPEDQAAKLQSVRAGFASSATVPSTPLVAAGGIRRLLQQQAAAARPSPLRSAAVPMTMSPQQQQPVNDGDDDGDGARHELSVLQARFAALEAELASTQAQRDEALAEVARLRKLVEQQPAPVPAVPAAMAVAALPPPPPPAMAAASGNVRVYCRVRPALAHEPMLSADHRLVVSARSIAVVRREKSLQSAALVEKTREFDLSCFGPTSTQEEVFDVVKPLVRMAMDGKSACVFAFGQTASGKTFTMLGTEQALGVIPRAIDLVFAHAERNAARGTSFEFRVAYCEHYCDQVFDLFSACRTSLQLRQAGNSGPVTVVGLSWVGVASRAQLCQLLFSANQARATTTTNKNDNSSRSHTVLQLEITSRSAAGERKCGMLSLIDLAGSERVSASGVVGAQLREAQAINSSLAVLGDVVGAIAAGRAHVPFRESKLTRLLEPYLVADEAKTVLLVTLSPQLADATETMSSLQFAAKAANISAGTK
jgi:kinesin family member C1